MPTYDLSAQPGHPDHGPVVVGETPCTGCGYDLQGIPVSGVCPECGRGVTLSLRGQSLRFASPEYIQSIDSGLSIILTAIFIYAACVILNAFLFVRNKMAVGSGPTGYDIAAAGLSLLPSLLFIWGYWKFTTPDPGFTGRETAVSARNIARIAACVQAGAQVIGFVAALGGAPGAFVPTPGPAVPAASLVAPTPMVGLAQAATLMGFAAWATLYLAITLYIRHVARRVPDHELVARTKGYIWLLPVIHVLVCGVGPIISLVLYASMFQTLRERTREIKDWQERGGRHVFGD